jgi:DNA helicase HerA-like ATPase
MTARSLVDPDYYVGTVTFVNASTVQANLPQATARPERRRLSRGAVGDFVFIDCEQYKLLGRILEVRIPDAERLMLEPTLGTPPDPNPIGRIQLLATIDQAAQRLQRGLKTHPRVGDGVYLATSEVFGALISNTSTDPNEISLELGTLDAGGGFPIKLSAEKVFGRHCGVMGATGGGKSWTIAALLQQIKQAGGRAILFDPTGEFADLPTIAKHYTFNQAEGAAQIVYFPYQSMTENDLFTLVRPSGQSQGPRLRDAIRSLKLVSAAAGAAIAGVSVTTNGLVEKMNKPRQPFFAALDHYKQQVNTPGCTFNIHNLPDQIQNECVWSTNQNSPQNWGGAENNSLSYCESMIARLRTMIVSPELACLFGAAGVSLVDILNDFCANENDDIIRISFKNVRFEHHTREILLNIIGRYLLDCARREMFRDKPMIVFLDEAHQFLGRTVGDEYGSVFLDAFGLIAKEGRKYGLTCTLATQRPRDIPADVLSQLGTLIVHRLTNDHDRETVEKACGDLDRNAAMFIPTLAPGEAIIIGPDLPAPVPMQISRPTKPPNSRGPQFNKYWAARTQPPQPPAQPPTAAAKKVGKTP